MSAPSEIRDKLDRIIDAFEEDWLNGARPRIESFLATAGASRRELLIELAYTDMEYRLRGGEKHVIEDFIRRFPELKSDPQTFRSLIAEEFRLRRRLNQNPNWEEYQKRFPDQTIHLDSQVVSVSDTVAANLPTRAPLSGVKLPDVSKRYKPQRIVAEGGMGFVARVVDTEFDRPLAMKVLSPKFRGNAELEQRFLREARLTGQLQHPGIPPVQDKGRLEDGTPYFIMKLIKGHSLAKLLKDRASPKDRIGHFVSVFASICQTMAYAHSRGIIHRDLKPANIMVGAFGEVQVMDWGLAKVLRSGLAKRDTGESSAIDHSNTVHILNKETSVGQHTVAGVVMGTPGYMAPEQARGEIDKLDQRCDVFGLGGILCDILTGKAPFAATDGASSQSRAMLGDITDTYKRLDASGADSELINIAKSCLSPIMTDRPADATSVARAITTYQAQVEERLKQAELEQTRLITKSQEEKKRRRDRRILGGCIAGLFVVGVLAWYWNQRIAADSISQAAAKPVTKQIEQAVKLVDLGDAELKMESLADAKVKLDQARLIVEHTRGAKPTNLNAEDGKTVDDQLTDFDARSARFKNDLLLAERLLDGFEARGNVVESDFNVERKSGVAFGKGGPEIYRNALRDYGAPIDASPAENAVKLKAFPRSPRLAEVLGVALTDWYLLEPDAKARQRIFELAESVDPLPQWRQLREAIKTGNVDDLVKLSLASHSGPKRTRFVVILADALQAAGRPEEAIDMLVRACEDDPSDFWVNESLGLFLTQFSPPRSDEALNCFEMAYVIRPKSPVAVAGLANALMSAMRFQKADVVCRLFLTNEDPHNTRVRAIWADGFIRTGRFSAAEEILREGLKGAANSGFLNAGLARLRLNQAKALEDFERKAKAKQAHDILEAKLAKDHESFVDRLVVLGYAELFQGYPPKQILKTGDLLANWNPRFSSGLDIKSRAHLGLWASAVAEQKEKEAGIELALAERYAKAAIENDPNGSAAYATLGEIQFGQKAYMLGFQSFKRAAENSVGPVPFLRAPAKTLFDRKLESEAGWLYAEIVKHDTRDAVAWNELLKVMRLTGEVREAKLHLGDAFVRLTREQRNTFDAIPAIDRRPVNPINGQQIPRQQPVNSP